jgi:hypothetical protein
VRPTRALLDEAVASARLRLDTAIPGSARDARLVAVGWATVESERAEAELSESLGPTLGPFRDAPGDAHLGARCRTAEAGPLPTLVIIEPATEGRLAEALARAGEGPLVAWFAVSALPTTGLSAAAEGPFGLERLVLGSPRDGRHVLLAEGGPGTIAT